MREYERNKDKRRPRWVKKPKLRSPLEQRNILSLIEQVSTGNLPSDRSIAHKQVENRSRSPIQRVQSALKALENVCVVENVALNPNYHGKNVDLLVFLDGRAEPIKVKVKFEREGVMYFLHTQSSSDIIVIKASHTPPEIRQLFTSLLQKLESRTSQ